MDNEQKSIHKFIHLSFIHYLKKLYVINKSRKMFIGLSCLALRGLSRFASNKIFYLTETIKLNI